MPWTTPTDRTTGYTVTAADWNIVEDDLTYLYGDTGWTSVGSFTNGWSGTPAYILLGRVVFLRGAMNAGTANTAAFTLPAGYRPTSSSNFIVSAGGSATNTIVVATTGTVTPVLSANVFLASISYPVV